MGEKLRTLFRRFVLYAQNYGGEFGEVVRENLVILFRRFLLFAWDVRCDHANNHDAKLRAKPGFGTISLPAGITAITELAAKSGLTNRLPCSEMIAGVWMLTRIAAIGRFHHSR